MAEKPQEWMTMQGETGELPEGSSFRHPGGLKVDPFILAMTDHYYAAFRAMAPTDMLRIVHMALPKADDRHDYDRARADLSHDGLARLSARVMATRAKRPVASPVIAQAAPRVEGSCNGAPIAMPPTLESDKRGTGFGEFFQPTPKDKVEDTSDVGLAVLLDPDVAPKSSSVLSTMLPPCMNVEKDPFAPPAPGSSRSPLEMPEHEPDSGRYRIVEPRTTSGRKKGKQ